MTPEQVLSHKPRVLSQKQREAYFAEGYLLLERIIPDEWVQRLRAATEELVERSRKVAKPDAVWDLEPGHRPHAPPLRRVSGAADQDSRRCRANRPSPRRSRRSRRAMNRGPSGRSPIRARRLVRGWSCGDQQG